MLSALAVVLGLAVVYRLVLRGTPKPPAVGRVDYGGFAPAVSLGWLAVGLAAADLAGSLVDQAGQPVASGGLVVLVGVLLLAWPALAEIVIGGLALVGNVPEIAAAVADDPSLTVGLLALGLLPLFVTPFVGLAQGHPMRFLGHTISMGWAMTETIVLIVLGDVHNQADLGVAMVLVLVAGIAIAGSLIPATVAPLLGAGAVIGEMTVAAAVMPPRFVFQIGLALPILATAFLTSRLSQPAFAR